MIFSLCAWHASRKSLIYPPKALDRGGKCYARSTSCVLVATPSSVPNVNRLGKYFYFCASVVGYDRDLVPNVNRLGKHLCTRVALPCSARAGCGVVVIYPNVNRLGKNFYTSDAIVDRMYQPVPNVNRLGKYFHIPVRRDRRSP